MEQQEAALEGLLDLCRQPGGVGCGRRLARQSWGGVVGWVGAGKWGWRVGGSTGSPSARASAVLTRADAPPQPPGFLHAAFLSCDCRLERSNLFEDLASLLSKAAFPLSAKALGPAHLTSLEALAAVMQALGSRCVC